MCSSDPLRRGSSDIYKSTILIDWYPSVCKDAKAEKVCLVLNL